MGETDGDVAAPEERASQDPDERPSPAPDALQVPVVKRRKKSPTPLNLRGRSATPIRGRSQTPFSLYLNRRSATPSTWRSITPFLKREDKEKTPFELGRDIKTQLYCNKAVFDKALIMDITEPEVPPVRYITSDMSVIDRAAVMDVSNVEVIYVVEEYEEYTEEEEEEEIVVEEVKPKKKEKKPRKGRTPRKSADRDSSSPGRTDESVDREDSVYDDDFDRSESAEPEAGETKKKKKAAPKKKVEKKESKISLKLEMGPGAKASKKMFDQAPPQPPPRPPPKKSKIALQMEEQAKAAAAKAEEDAKKNTDKPKNETFAERQARLKAEAEEQARLEAEALAQQEAEEAAAAAEEAAEADMEHDGEHDEGGEEEGDHTGDEMYAEDNDENEYNENEEAEGGDEFDENIKRRESKVSIDSFTRPNLEDEERWQKIAEEEGEEFMLQLRKYSMAMARSERERDADWQKRREQARLPHFINFLTDRTVEAGHNVRLACAVDGPELSVKWFKDGRQLERDNTHRIANNNNILTLEVVNTVPTDSGEYSCVIANINDEVTSSCIVTVYEVYKDEPSPPTFSLIRDFYHLHDDELTIECHVHGIPRPKVTWLFGAFEIKPSYKFTLLEEAHGVYKLLIFRPSNKDAGKYICKAENDSGEAQIDHTIEVAKNKNFHVHGIFRARDRISREKELVAKKAMDAAMASKKESDMKRAEIVETRAPPRSTVNEPLVSPKNKLQIATQLRDRMALEGSTIKLFCNVTGPSPACRWMKDDKWIVVGPTIRNLTEEGKAVLELVKVTAEASGQYKLVAKNEYSEVDTSCFVRVYGAQAEGDEQEPMFALPIRDVYHSSENDLIIDTKVRGNPRPTISWFKDSQTVVLDDRIQQIEHLDGVCELIINKPTPQDSGEYACEAINKLGHTKQTHSVVVEPSAASRRSSQISKMGEEGEGKGKGAKKERKKEDPAETGTYERRSRMPDPSPKMSLYFIGNMSNRYLAEGNKVKLQAVIGGPDPTMKWLKDGQPVVFGPKIRNLSRDGLAVLDFVKATVEDSGTYTLIVRNEACEISTSALLHIYQPDVKTDVVPVFVRSIKETYHLNTNELILETGCRGQPTPTVTWFKDSVEIKNDDRCKVIAHADGTSELIIDQPNEKDSGKYVVKAENSAGKAESLHLVVFKGKATHIADNIHGVFHADKSLLKKKEEEKPAAAEEPAEAEKGKKGKKGKDDDEAILVIPDVPAKEEKREKRIGIHFKAHLNDRCVAEGSRVKLTAYCECSETPAVKWTHDDQQVVYGPKTRQSYREGLCVLELVSASEADSGLYKCTAKDSVGEVSTTCKLEVYKRPDNADVPPTFTRAIKDSYHEKANEVVLNVHVRGLPTPTITWVKDDVKIEPSDKYQLTHHADGTCELFISNPVNADSGKYVCQAENSKDKAEITHLVHIEVRKKRASSPGRSIPAAAKALAEETEEEKEKKKEKKKKEEEEEASSSRREVPPPPDLRKRLYLRNFLSNRTVPEGSNVRWCVNIDGPDPTARWYLNDQMIAFGPKSKLACQDGICWLQLVGVTEEQAGELKLVVKGPENEVSSTCTLFVYKVKKEEEEVAPVFTVGIKDSYSLHENELVLDCRVRGYPRPEIQWMKGNDLITADNKYRPLSLLDGYCKLTISNPTEKDAGVYACVARNSVKESKITHQLDFKGKDRAALEKTHGFFHRDPNKPHLQAPLGDQIVTPGGTIAITAEFLPTSSPIDVQWFRSREPLAGQPNVKTFHDHGVYTLAISNAASEWEGTYTCRATNAFGKLETHANVDIAERGGKAAGPPLFLSRPETEMKIAVGDPFSISFRLQGEPKPKLTLLKGTKDITKAERISKEASDDYIRFNVQKAQISDSGTYFVLARNEYGTDRVFVTITVNQRARSATPTSRWGQPLESFPDTSYFRDPPGPISTEPTVIDAGKSHISLSWGKPQSENSAPVIAYRVDAWIVGKEGGAIWKEIGMTPINSFDAFNLMPNYEYHFRVTPKNRYGWGPSVQTRSPVQVGGAECLPEFVKILPGQTKALLGKQCTFECVVQGAPRPKILWYKDGLLIDSSDRVRIKQFGSVCTLFISQVFDIDSGRYTCEATNTKGRVSTFARLQVVADEKLYAADHKLKELITSDNVTALGETIPIFTMRLRDRRVQVTYPVRLTCQVMGYPRPEVTWYKGDNVVEESKRTVITDDGQFITLEITSTKLDDSDTYTCTARNELGSVSCHCSLFVDKGIRAYISPDFYMPLEPLYVFKEGEEIRLTAKVEAYPSVGVSWHRNGAKLRPSRRILTTLDSNGFVELIIAEATQKDAGIYVCAASNAVGRVETSTRVTVEEVTESERKKLPVIRANNLPYSKEPLFVVKPRSSEAYEGDTVIIFCEVIGDPKPDVVWLRDFLKPEYYKDAPHFRRVGDGPEYRLEIPSAKLDFTGTYSIIASNCHGQTQAIISLQIYAKDINKVKSMEKGSIRHGNVETLPLFLRQLKDLRCCDGDAVTLECNVEAVPEPAIIWEKDGHVLHSGKDVDMIYDGIKAVLSIRRIYPEDEGEYTCVAKNNVGRAFSSACIIVDVPEEKENLLSRQLARPSGLLSANSTPRSTPRTTPNRSVSPLRLSFRHTSIDLTTNRRTVAAPKFYAIPHNKVVEEGDSVRFQCAITGHPTPWSTWDKDGMIVTPTTRISVKEVDDLRIVEIDEVTFDDAGLYRITLENDYGRIEATARLDVIGSSKHSKSPMGRTVRSTSSRRNFFISRRIMGPSTRIGGRMALSTSMRGSSVPARKFYHNGDEIMESDRVQIILTDSEARLIVDSVTEADEGIYTCIAQDEYDAQATSTAVAFYDDETDIPCDPPKIVRHLSETLEVYEGVTTDLAFELESFEPYEYVWTRNGEVLPDSSEFKYIDHGNGIICLRIQDTFDLDTGLYECTVTSTYGTCSTRCDLQVDDRYPTVAGYSQDDVDRSSGLAILKNPLPVLGMEGMITSFCAKVYPPNSKTSWTICGRDVTVDSRNFSLEESHSDGVRILHVLGLDYSHSGEVQFTVQSALRPKTDRITTCTSLVVLPGLPRAHFQLDKLANEEASAVPAFINQGPTDCTALVGETVRLNVTFGGYPVPSVKWFKAGRPIIEGSNIKIHTTAEQSILELKSIIADDSGKYTVEVMNDHSSYYSAASVAVEGPPEPPSGKPCISQGPDRIAVAWCGPPYDGGCMLTGFIIEMEEENNGAWKEIATVVDSLAYTVKNLTPKSAYRFRVRAENVHGRSEPSLPSDRVEISGPEVSNEDFQKPISVKEGGDFKQRFEVLEELGKGRFGVVYKVQEKDSSQILAAKVIKCIKSVDRKKVKEEISIMKCLQHPKLLQLAASFESPREIVMVMEYITGGELFERVVADDFTLTERDCILFLRQVCEGVDYMHSQSIVHLDLKPENIMCHTRTSHQIKIIDFGLAQRLNSDSPVRVLFGTPEFIPPEIISYEPISFQSDMWSVGVVCYVLLSGLSPFMGDTDSDTFSNITRADYDFEDDAFDSVSQEAKDFISNLLIHRKEDRLTAKECLESKWLTQHHDENLNNNKICTDKLKKFIIRRKWQKTGNAIRALGRMANLSASRRNSAVSTAGSVPSSPRPSISGTSIFSPNVTAAHMTSLNEEEDDFNPELPSVELKLKNSTNSLKVRDKTQCSERSDSGFSECSNCSGGVNNSCHCPNAGTDRSNIIPKDPEEDHSPLSVAVPHDILKTKLEEIAKTQLVEHDGSETSPITPPTVTIEMSKSVWDRKPAVKENEPEDLVYLESRSPDLQFSLDHKSLNVPVETAPIMRSDFTNTIQMRKKSLENNLLKEKAKPPKVIIETSGKVSMLKNKFSQGQSAAPAISVSRNFECKTNTKPSNDVCRPKNVFDRLTSSNKSNGPSKTSVSVSLPGSPLPTRSATTMRLSGRVREATERLSQPKTPQATRKFTNNTITTSTTNNNNEINLKKTPSDHHHAKNLKAFKGLS